jgi:MFS family permease
MFFVGSLKNVTLGLQPQDLAMTIDSPAGISPLSARQIAAVVAGNGLDFYDFLTYSFFSAQIGKALFPGDAASGLLLALATFGVGFLTRPLGGIVIGRLADRHGRKPAMLFTFALMGFAIVGLALTPSYATIGMAAPVLAVTFRMLQGFALGGEVGPNTAFLVEAAPAHRRAFYVSLQYASQDLSVMVAGVVGLVLSNWFSAQGLVDWGWRIAFLIGATIIPFGLIIRRSLSETLSDHNDDVTTGAPRSFIVVGIAGMLLIGCGTIGNYTINYLNTFAQTVLGLSATTAFTSTIIYGGVGAMTDLASGWAADRYGPRRVVVIPILLLALVTMPTFLGILHFRSASALLMATLVLTIMLDLSGVGALLLVTQSLPQRIRASGLGAIYALGVAVFGGSTQFIEQLLIRETGNPIAPGWYMTGGLTLGLIGLLILRRRVPSGEDVRLHPDPALLA